MTDVNFHIGTQRLYISYFIPSVNAHCDHLVGLYVGFAPTPRKGAKPTSITTREAARDYITNQVLAEHARNGYGRYIVSLKPTDVNLPANVSFPEKLALCKHVGMVTLLRGDKPTSHTIPDIGFVTLSEERGKGYAKEAALALMAYVKREKGIEVVLGVAIPSNEASQTVLRSLGLENRGTLGLTEFSGEEYSVWITPGAAEDLSVYNIC